GVLREAARGLLPDDVIDRPKMPYPTTHHPVYAASFRDRLRQVMGDSTSPLVGLVNRSRVMELLDMDPRAWDLPWFGQMMGVPALFAYLVQCEAWLRDQGVTIRI
ncbi:MAG: asparagine synthase-related protein, partial [Clostridia bacterium]